MNWDDNHKRKRAEAPLADVSAEVLSWIPKMSDAEWAEQDAKAQREITEREEMNRRTNAPRVKLEDLGWLAKTLMRARSVTRTTEAMARLHVHNFRRKSIAIVSGPTGTGKTIAAACWALVRREPRTHFVTAAKFASSSRYEGDQRQWLDADELVLDDLGAEYMDGKGSFLADLDNLIDSFYASGRTLIVTTNQPMAAFGARYGARISDRLIEAAEWIAVAGESLRTPGAP